MHLITIQMSLHRYVMLAVVFSLFPYQVQSQKIPLTINNLNAVHVKAEELHYKKKKAIRITGMESGEQIAIINHTNFKNGTIEMEVAGQPLPGSNANSRGFIGIAFRVQQSDSIRYECFYLRPTNGRAEDQLRRNHSTQYVSHPRYPWAKLRKENPGVYEAYVDLAVGEWTTMKITVKDKDARLYINGSDQPCLIVPAMKGDIVAGPIALWIGSGTDGYFSNLKINSQ